MEQAKSVHPRGMRNRTRLGLTALFGASALMVVACGDDPAAPGTPPVGGSAGSLPATGGNPATAGSTTGGQPGTAGTTVAAAGTDAVGGSGAGTGGSSAGTAAGGTGAGTGGQATAGTGGTGVIIPPIVPTVFLIDNIRLQLKGSGSGGSGGTGGTGGAGGAAGSGGAGGTGGAGGATGGGGAGGGGAGGGGAGGAGGATGGAGAGGVGGAAGGTGGSGGSGGAPVIEPNHGVTLTFDATLEMFQKNLGGGWSPGPGGSGGPAIIDGSTLLWEAGTGNPGGAAKASIPFTVPTQQADLVYVFPAPVNLFGYELLADIKMTMTGDAGTCATAWMYVYGTGGYANDKTGEPSSGVTSHLVPNVWTTVRLDLDGPYGFHSVQNHPNFTPSGMGQMGIQLNTWGCP